MKPDSGPHAPSCPGGYASSGPHPSFRVAIAVCVVAGAAGLLEAATVTLRLISPQQRQVVAPGTAIEWSVDVRVSGDDNAGLALVVFDIVQDETNPEKFDVPPVREVPAAMTRFSRPLGISNPGEGGLATGYVGVQRGAPGARNLIQIGGAQNTTGRTGTAMGQSAIVAEGVGQASAVVVARGSFAAPSASGDYVFRLADALANVLVEVRDAPEASTVASATIELGVARFSFTVEGGPQRCENGCFIRGDCNGDGLVVGSVTDAVFLLQFNFIGGPRPPCLAACDVNGDGSVIGSVTDAVALLQFGFLGGAPPPPPYPECGEGTRASDARLGCDRGLEVCR